MANQKKLQLQGFQFKPFSNKQMSILSFWQDNSPVADKFMIVADGSIRSGKSQPYWAKIYTPDGYKSMGDIQVGDYVLDRYGKPTKVLGIFPQGKLPVYKITFHDGSVSYSSRDHLWTYNTVFDAEDELRTTTLGKFIDISPEHYYKYRFPLNGCVEFAESSVTVSPYKMGLFLGCDDLANNITYLGNQDELYEYVLKFGCDFESRWIPSEYIYNSVEVRRKVLAGLLEAGGIVYTNTPTIQFKSSSSRLMTDITELARSLGMFVDSQNGLVFIQVDAELVEMFHEPFRKRLKLEGNILEKWRVPVSVKYYSDAECQCIYVDNDEHLYLTDDFVVTHNTVCMVLSFVLFVMTHFNQQNAAMCGKMVCHSNI